MEEFMFAKIQQKLKLITKNDWITLVAVLLFAFILLYLAEKVQTYSVMLCNMLKQLASVSLISGVLAVILRRQTMADIIDKTTQCHNYNNAILETGVFYVSNKFVGYPYDKEISRVNSQMDIYAVYSSTWLTNNLSYIKELCKKDVKIRFCFLDYESPAIPVLEKKFVDGGDFKTGDLQEKIHASIRLVQKYFLNSKAHIDIYLQPYVPQYCLYRFDNRALFIPYSLAAGRGDVPLIASHATANDCSLFHAFTCDFEKLLKNHARKL